jgi:hypothetical protein
MVAFRTLLIVGWVALVAYTANVIAHHGLNLLPVFFGDIGRGEWSGQFNSDFLCFLVLSAVWTAWRNSFSLLGLFLGAIAFFGGAGFLLPYLLFLSLRSGESVGELLLGARGKAG